MSKSIEVQQKNLDFILGDKNNFYQVPNYQRPYSWNKEHIYELINDLVEFFVETQGSEEYFCGSIVLIGARDGKRQDIIDGQQRLTTFTILACVIRDIYMDQLGEKAKDMVKLSIESKYDESEDRAKLKFATDEAYYTLFKETFINNKLKFEKVRSIEKDKELRKNKYLQNAYYIKECLEQAIKDNALDINTFVIWIYEKIFFTIVICLNEEHAIRIFNVLNDRGMPLSPIDILKSTLMQKIKEEERQAFKVKWQAVTSRIEESDLSVLSFFSVYAYYRIARNPKRQLIEGELLKDLKNKDSIYIIEEIAKFAEIYVEIHDTPNKYIYCLKNLNTHIYWQSIICTAKFLNVHFYDELLQYVMAFYYQNYIGGATANRYKQTSFDILKKLKEGASLEEIKNKMIENLNKMETTQDFREWFDDSYKQDNDGIKYNVYDERWIKPLLILIEYFSADSHIDGASYIEWNKKLTVEHILPQKPKEGSYWTKRFTQEEREQWTNSLANLTLLSLKKNSQASNNDFQMKKEVFFKKDNAWTTFGITQSLRDYSDWGIDELKKREQEMVGKITEQLDIFGN